MPQRLVVRDPARAPALPAAEVATADYAQDDAIRRALAGTGTLYLVSAEESADRVSVHRAAVRAALAVGVERVVYTSFIGAAPDATFTLARDHHVTEVALRETGMRCVFLRDGLYMDVLPHFAGEDGVIRGPAGAGRLTPVARDDIADVSVQVLLDDGHDDATYDLTGPESLTMTEVAERITATTGRQVSFHDETVAEAYASRRALGAPDWQVEAWVSTYLAVAAGEMDVTSDAVERVLGRPPISFSEHLRIHPPSA